MNPVIDIKRLVRQYVAPHRRNGMRLGWLRSLIDLQDKFDCFSIWRDEYRYRVQINSQTLTLTLHLRSKFNSREINIESYSDNDVLIGNNNEPNYWKEIALNQQEETEFLETAKDEDKKPYLIPFPLSDENAASTYTDFFVEIPKELEEKMEQIGAEVDKYKLANKTFSILIK